MTISIEELTFNSILGILEYERLNPQVVSVDCKITYQYCKDSFINYADVAAYIETTMQEQQFELIETALEFLTSSLKKMYPSIEYINLTIKKPTILKNAVVGVTSETNF